MVLRRTPPPRHRLAEAMTGVTMSPGDVWWELVDPAAGDDDPPAGVALTRAVEQDGTHVVVLRRSAEGGEDPSRDVLALLVAAMRSTRARRLSMSPDEQTPAPALLDAGFMPDDESAVTELHVLLL